MRLTRRGRENRKRKRGDVILPRGAANSHHADIVVSKKGGLGDKLRTCRGGECKERNALRVNPMRLHFIPHRKNRGSFRSKVGL